MPVRYSNGVTTVASDKCFGQLIIPDPTQVSVYMNHFNKFVPDDWFITRIHAGATLGAETVGDTAGGVLSFYPANADDDSTFFQYKAYSDVETASELWSIEAGKKLWFKAKFNVSDVTQSDFFMGLQSADTTPLTSPVDRIMFYSDDGDANLDFSVYAASVSTLSDTAIATLSNSTYFTVGFYYDGGNALRYFYSDNATVANENQDGYSVSTTLPSANMTITFGVQNGAAAAKTMNVDYICVIRET